MGLVPHCRLIWLGHVLNLCIFRSVFQKLQKPTIEEPDEVDNHDHNGHRNGDRPVDPQPRRGFPTVFTESEKSSTEESL